MKPEPKWNKEIDTKNQPPNIHNNTLPKAEPKLKVPEPKKQEPEPKLKKPEPKRKVLEPKKQEPEPKPKIPEPKLKPKEIVTFDQPPIININSALEANSKFSSALCQISYLGPPRFFSTSFDECFHQVMKNIINNKLNGWNMSRDALLKKKKFYIFVNTITNKNQLLLLDQINIFKHNLLKIFLFLKKIFQNDEIL